MPLMAINLSDMLFGQIKDQVEKGNYASLEQFLEIAAFNQLAMERGASPAELVEKGHRKLRTTTEPSTNGTARVEKPKPNPVAEPPPKGVKAVKAATPRRVSEPVARITQVDDTALTTEVMDAALKRLSILPRTADSPKPGEPTADGPTDDRVFGQVNRLMPLKLACRWLANRAVTDGKWPRFEHVSDLIADDAATIGTMLEKWDIDNERKRDEMLATGLPRRGNSASRDRFLSQFIARVTRANEIYPAVICQYQLARFHESVVMLTDRGQAFSELENLILDKKDQKAGSTLTPEESAFLAHQIAAWVPAERSDMRVVLKAVGDGKTTPLELAETVRANFPAEWSDSSYQTHLSGLIARLDELRLLRRNWQGRNVNYELGERTQVDNFTGTKSQERPES